MSATTLRHPLAPGARVVVRDEEWLVLGTNPASCGGEAVRVRGLSELVRDREAIFLTVLDEIQVLSPEETDLVVFNQTQQISAHRN